MYVFFINTTTASKQAREEKEGKCSQPASHLPPLFGWLGESTSCAQQTETKEEANQTHDIIQQESLFHISFCGLHCHSLGLFARSVSLHHKNKSYVQRTNKPLRLVSLHVSSLPFLPAPLLTKAQPSMTRASCFTFRSVFRSWPSQRCAPESPACSSPGSPPPGCTRPGWSTPASVDVCVCVFVCVCVCTGGWKVCEGKGRPKAAGVAVKGERRGKESRRASISACGHTPTNLPNRPRTSLHAQKTDPHTNTRILPARPC
jgi:hypothetical protein